MGNIITDKAIRTLGRVWVPSATELDSKASDGTPNFEAGVEWGIVIGDEIVRGKFVTPVNSASLFGSAFAFAKDAVREFFGSIPLTGNAAPTKVVEDSPSGARKVTTTIPATTVSAANPTPVAAAAPAVAPAPAAEAAPKRRGRPPANPAPAVQQPPPEPTEPEPGDPEPGDAEPGDSEPVSASGKTLAELGNVVCIYGQKTGKMHGKTLSQLDDAQLEFIVKNPSYEKFMNQPEFAQLRKDTQEYLELRALLGQG